MPPLVGFFGKFLLFRSIVAGGFLWLAVATVLNSAISAYLLSPGHRHLVLSIRRTAHADIPKHAGSLSGHGRRGHHGTGHRLLSLFLATAAGPLKQSAYLFPFQVSKALSHLWWLGGGTRGAAIVIVVAAWATKGVAATPGNRI